MLLLCLPSIGASGDLGQSYPGLIMPKHCSGDYFDRQAGRLGTPRDHEECDSYHAGTDGDQIPLRSRKSFSRKSLTLLYHSKGPRDIDFGRSPKPAINTWLLDIAHTRESSIWT